MKKNMILTLSFILVVIFLLVVFVDFSSFKKNNSNEAVSKEITPKEMELDKSAIKRLDGASTWLITEITGKLYSDPSYIDNQLAHDLVDKFKITMLNKPTAPPEEGHPIRYIPKSRGIYYDIERLESKKNEKILYEFWAISISSKKWATWQKKESRFIVTKTDNEKGKREIIKKENQFFGSFEVENEKIFNFNIEEDLKLRYKLRPWFYRDCFENYPDFILEEEIEFSSERGYFIKE